MIRKSPVLFIFKWLGGLIAVLAGIFCLMHFVVLPWYDGRSNAIYKSVLDKASDSQSGFHQQSFVADLHADALLWARDLRLRHNRGHIDIPRLRQGGVDLQVFSAVTKVPGSADYYSNASDSDQLPLLFIATWRHPATWFSPKKRALVQAAELRRLADQGLLKLVTSRDDLSSHELKGLLSLEGMHALEADADALDELYAAGFRMMGLAHHFDNAVAGSAHGLNKTGLTPLGRRLVPRMEALGITIDLAHASSATISETLALATRPVVVSHTGVAATCPGPRNLSDDQIRAIASNRGIIGIGFWKGAVCSPGLGGIVSAILHVIDIAGIDHVALGSDFDGHVKTPFDVTGLPGLTTALLDAGLNKESVSKIIGGNVLRLLQQNLPP